ncbi:hypothetical protein AMATHDRAFT_47311 [Amanita thiersii Skay4041]|uniref:HMG box domain-containing protein n=1 Tax=Amanita thiersii Skay4041 TaxID=703135 RepID=A0A2A9NM36_9AGAR|nr:hypothetical protein AMATHDRAFT_47311 [Amanita thiersii Skay4041]
MEHWHTLQSGPTDPQVLFAPMVTPGTFTKSEYVEPMNFQQSGDSLLFPPTQDSLCIRRGSHNKRKPGDHIPRPPNAFILFRSSFIKAQHVSAEVETDHSTLSKIIGITWQNMPEQERQMWHERARLAKEEHRRRFPHYTFRPAKSKNGKQGKKTARDMYPKDLKRCERIAQLLIEGMKGEELETAMQEFDKHHVPPIVTKFEEPITAQVFARSSSAPLGESGDRGNNNARPAATTKVPDSRRASSAQPAVCRNTSQPKEFSRSLHDLSAQVAPCPSLNNNPAHSHFNNYNFDNNSYYLESPIPPDTTGIDSCESGYTSGYNTLATIATAQRNIVLPELLIDTSFAGLDTWPTCSTPCSESPTTPSSSSVLYDAFPLPPHSQSQSQCATPQHESIDLAATAPFPALHTPQAIKPFVDFSSSLHDYRSNLYPNQLENLIPFYGQVSCNHTHVQTTPIGYDLPQYIPPMTHGSF